MKKAKGKKKTSSSWNWFNSSDVDKSRLDGRNLLPVVIAVRIKNITYQHYFFLLLINIIVCFL